MYRILKKNNLWVRYYFQHPHCIEENVEAKRVCSLPTVGKWQNKHSRASLSTSMERQSGTITKAPTMCLKDTSWDTIYSSAPWSMVSLSTDSVPRRQPWSKNINWKMQEINNSHILNFVLFCSEMKLCTTPLCPAQEMNHPFVYRIHTIHTSCSLVTWQLSWLSDLPTVVVSQCSCSSDHWQWHPSGRVAVLPIQICQRESM